MLNDKKEKIHVLKDRLENGLEKMNSAAEQVAELHLLIGVWSDEPGIESAKACKPHDSGEFVGDDHVLSINGNVCSDAIVEFHWVGH